MSTATSPAKKRVETFIVEDSPVILENLIATLEELSPIQVVGSASDESTALRWLLDDSHPCSLVIIDIYLRSGSGLEVLRCAARAGVPAKRVVLTNYATHDMREKCAQLGADRLFDKSNELDDLIAYCSRLGTDEAGNSARR